MLMAECALAHRLNLLRPNIIGTDMTGLRTLNLQWN